MTQQFYGQYPTAGGPPGQLGQPQQSPSSAYYSPVELPASFPPVELPASVPSTYQQQGPQGPSQSNQYQQYNQGPPTQYQHQPYPPPQALPAQYGQYPPNTYQGPNANQQPGAPQWQQPVQSHQHHPVQSHGYGVAPTPASVGYDPAQRAYYAPVDTSADVEVIRKAMKGFGCDEAALISVFTSPRYENPWAMAQLVQDYSSRFVRDLADDIKSETRGDLETLLLALVRGPLEQDVRVLIKALDGFGTDEDALMDVLLCRSNADIRAISDEYRRIKGHDLLIDIKGDVDDTLFRLYSMVLAATRAEDMAPVNPEEIDEKVTELQCATEGIVGANAISVAHIFTGSNAAQLNAISDAYERKYQRSLEDVIGKEFRGDVEDALLYMLESAVDRARTDAKRLEEPLHKTIRKDRLFINRVVSLYWNRSRLEAAKSAYEIYSTGGVSLSDSVKMNLSGDYMEAILALLAEKR